MYVITGPTASGKTGKAVALARAIGGEIISADSRQLYVGMDLGTGKDLDEYGNVPYHMIDICEAGYKYNLFEYLRDYQLCYDDITENEIYAFCTRAINCITHNLFFIVRPEEFKINQERFLFKTLNKLLEKNENKINSCIIVLYINQDSHIVKQLIKIKEKYEFPQEPPLFKNIEDSQIENLKDLPIEVVRNLSEY